MDPVLGAIELLEMVATEGFARRLRPTLVNVLLLAVAAVVLSRAVVLYRKGDVMTAHSEKRFFEFFYGAHVPAVSAPLTQAAPLLRDGEAVCLRSEVMRNAEWLQVMGVYFLSHQTVVVPRETSGAGAPVCRRTLLRIGSGPSPVLWRLADARR